MVIEHLMKHARSSIHDLLINSVDQSLSRTVFMRLLSVRLDQMPSSVGSLAAQMNAYQTVRGFLTTTATHLIVDAPFVIIFLVLMGFIGHPILCVVPLFFFMVSLIIGVWSRKRLEVLTNQASALSNFKTGILVESIEGAEVIKSGHGGWRMLTRWMTEIEGRMTASKNKYLQETRTELTRIEDELSVQLQKLNGAENLLYHTDLTAPMDGVVKSLKIHTLGGVLRPGDELMNIAPVGDNLLIESKVLPADIGHLVVGQKVQISLDAYDSSLYGNLTGELIEISPDTLSDTNAQGSLVNTPNGQPSVYYKVNIRLDKTQANPKHTQIEVKPGMTASIDIRTGTLLNYLMKPVIKT